MELRRLGPNQHGLLHVFAGGIPLMLSLLGAVQASPDDRRNGGSKGGVLLPLIPSKRCIFPRCSGLYRRAFPQETSVGFEKFQRAPVQNKVIKFQNSSKTARRGEDAHREVQAETWICFGNGI